MILTIQAHVYNIVDSFSRRLNQLLIMNNLPNDAPTNAIFGIINNFNYADNLRLPTDNNTATEHTMETDSEDDDTEHSHETPENTVATHVVQQQQKHATQHSPPSASTTERSVRPKVHLWP